MTETRTIELPPALPPVTTRMITSNPSSDSEDLSWEAGKEHPLIKGAVIVRMYVIPDGGGVDVYSVLAGGRGATRHHIPDSRIHITEEAMPIDVLIEELKVAESTDDEEEEEEEEEEDEVIQAASSAPVPTSPVAPSIASATPTATSTP